MILGLVLICYSSYRGVVELLRDLFDTPISIGTVHNRLQSTAATAINQDQDLSGNRDEDTWGWHLLDVMAQGFDPTYAIVDGYSGFRAGQKIVMSETPCQGDVFHIQQQFEQVANSLVRRSQGGTTRLMKQE